MSIPPQCVLQEYLDLVHTSVREQLQNEHVKCWGKLDCA